MRALSAFSFSSWVWGRMTDSKVAAAGFSAGLILATRESSSERVWSHRAWESATMLSLVPVKSGGAWGGFAYLAMSTVGAWVKNEP